MRCVQFRLFTTVLPRVSQHLHLDFLVEVAFSTRLLSLCVLYHDVTRLLDDRHLGGVFADIDFTLLCVCDQCLELQSMSTMTQRTRTHTHFSSSSLSPARATITCSRAVLPLASRRVTDTTSAPVGFYDWRVSARARAHAHAAHRILVGYLEFRAACRQPRVGVGATIGVADRALDATGRIRCRIAAAVATMFRSYKQAVNQAQFQSVLA